jgi:hypothetical protein
MGNIVTLVVGENIKIYILVYSHMIPPTTVTHHKFMTVTLCGLPLWKFSRRTLLHPYLLHLSQFISPTHTSRLSI